VLNPNHSVDLFSASRNLFNEFSMLIIEDDAHANEKSPENAIKAGVRCHPPGIELGKSPKVV
jgi:hypothetical protein